MGSFVPDTLENQRVHNTAVSRKGRAGSGPGGARVPKNGVLLKNGVLIVPHFCGENYFWPGFLRIKICARGCPYLKKMGYY